MQRQTEKSESGAAAGAAVVAESTLAVVVLQAAPVVLHVLKLLCGDAELKDRVETAFAEVLAGLFLLNSGKLVHKQLAPVHTMQQCNLILDSLSAGISCLGDSSCNLQMMRQAG